MTSAASSPERLRLGPIENPVRAALHGSAALFALALCGHLVASGDTRSYPRTFALLAASHAALYTTSALYHAVPWRPSAKMLMQRLDHAMIHIMVAATVTAIVLMGLEGTTRYAILAGIWLLAAAGIAQKLLTDDGRPSATLPIQFASGLLAAPALPAFVAQFPGPPSVLLIAGILAFAIGGVCFATKSPRAWPRVFSYHEVMHVCTVVGSGAHCLIFVRYL